MSYTVNHEDEQDKIDVVLGQHVLERFIERFPDIAEKIGFNDYWENCSWDENKQANYIFYCELFKRGKRKIILLKITLDMLLSYVKNTI